MPRKTRVAASISASVGGSAMSLSPWISPVREDEKTSSFNSSSFKLSITLRETLSIA
jgi:hypothetical protein